MSCSRIENVGSVQRNNIGVSDKTIKVDSKENKRSVTPQKIVLGGLAALAAISAAAIAIRTHKMNQLKKRPSLDAIRNLAEAENISKKTKISSEMIDDMVRNGRTKKDDEVLANMKDYYTSLEEVSSKFEQIIKDDDTYKVIDDLIKTDKLPEDARKFEFWADNLRYYKEVPFGEEWHQLSKDFGLIKYSTNNQGGSMNLYLQKFGKYKNVEFGRNKLSQPMYINFVKDGNEYSITMPNKLMTPHLLKNHSDIALGSEEGYELMREADHIINRITAALAL